MIDKVKNFFEVEYVSTKDCIDRKVDWATPEELVDVTIHQLLGITQFVQTLGVPYDEISTLYLNYKEKLEKLLDK